MSVRRVTQQWGRQVARWIDPTLYNMTIGGGGGESETNMTHPDRERAQILSIGDSSGIFHLGHDREDRASSACNVTKTPRSDCLKIFHDPTPWCRWESTESRRAYAFIIQQLMVQIDAWLLTDRETEIQWAFSFKQLNQPTWPIESVERFCLKPKKN